MLICIGGNRRRDGSESREMNGSRIGGMAAQKLPGNTPKIHKPHPPPSKLVPPGTRSRLVHMKRSGNPTHHTSPQHNRATNGYIVESDEHSYHQLGNHVHNLNARNLRSRDGPKNGQSHGSEPSEDISSIEDDRVRTFVLDQKRRGPVQRYIKYSPPCLGVNCFPVKISLA